MSEKKGFFPRESEEEMSKNVAETENKAKAEETLTKSTPKAEQPTGQKKAAKAAKTSAPEKKSSAEKAAGAKKPAAKKKPGDQQPAKEGFEPQLQEKVTAGSRAEKDSLKKEKTGREAGGKTGDLKEFFRKIGGGIVSGAKKTAAFFKKIGSKIAPAFHTVGQKLAPFFRALGKKLAPLWKKFMAVMSDVMNGSFFTIRNKLVLGFLVPVLFMIIIGVVAYNKARDGMGDKFAESTVQTIQMVQENVDSNCEFIRSVSTTLMLDGELKEVLTGRYKSNAVEESNLLTDFRKQLGGYQSGNKFIKNMHIVPTDAYRIISTATTQIKAGIRDAYRSDVMSQTGSFSNWIDCHSLLDETLGMKETDYIMAYQVMSDSNLAAIVTDISPDAILELLNILDLGEGSVVGFVSPGGRELISSQNKKIGADGEEAVFYGQDFFEEALAASETTGVMEKVRCKGQKCMFFYSRSELTGAVVCALVPISTVTDQAQEIRVVAIFMVIIACLAVLGIAFLIISGIQQNMRRISGSLGEVAEGDLTVKVSSSGQDEFATLAGSANHMVNNTKKLVGKVNDATTRLEESAVNVKNASDTISGSFYEISQVVEGISVDMENESSHAQDCVERANALSREIQEMARIVEKIRGDVQDTETMIGSGVEKVRLLGQHAQQTTDITMEVGQSIENLKTETAYINKFVAMIAEISSQTNLLSLNASIEAARAGEAGRGFSVVAAEIRKLADDSAKAAGEIRSNVGHIISRAEESVESAERAREMVDSQTEVVGQVIEIFKDMSQQMANLLENLKEVMEHTERTDAERERTVQAVENISGIIGETAENTEAVADTIARLMSSVQNLNDVSKALDENMNELKTEISSFKVE